MGETWCILRTAGRHTLALAQSLADEGFDVWTPAKVECRRVPRMNARREVRLPIMPGFVFASSRHLWTLFDKSEDPRTRFRFSLFRDCDRYPLVTDSELAYLRGLEHRLAKPKKAKRPIDPGTAVRVEGGSFGGLSGVVERSNRGETVVCFGGRWTVKVATPLLRRVEERKAA